MASNSFKAKMRAKHNSPRLRLTLDGTDYDDEVISISQIVRDAKLNAGTVEVIVDNSTKTFNTRITDATWDQQLSYVKLYFSGGSETLNLFAGIPYQIRYIGKNAVIKLRDRMATMLNRPYGDWDVPIAYWSATNNPADLAWDVLTDSDGGYLDSTESAANTDIDYTAWSAWKTDCTTNSLSIRANFTGTLTVRDILLRICELTDSYIWVNTDGKMDFAMHGGTSQASGSESYDDDNIIPGFKSGIPFLDINTDNIWNSVIAYILYDPNEDTWWARSSTSTDASSVSTYGTNRHIEADKAIWHNDAGSSSAYKTDFLNRQAKPRRYVQFETFMASWLEDIGSIVSVTNSLLSLSNKSMTITEMVLLPDEGKTRMKLWWDWD